MFGSEILEVVFGLLFIYLLLSLLATTINEILTTGVFSIRGRVLQKAIRSMLSDHFDPKQKLKGQEKPTHTELTDKDLPLEPLKDIGIAFYEHPLVYRFAKKGKNELPSYISKSNFSLVIIDLLGEHNSAERSFESIKATVLKLPEGGTRTILLALINNAQGDLDRFKAQLEEWFEEMMKRTSGWYKRHVQKILIVIGFVISMVFNADTFQIANKLSSDPEVRAQLVQMAEKYLAKTTAADSASLKTDSLMYPLFIRKMCVQSDSKEDLAYWCKMDSLNRQVDYLVQDQLNQATSVLGLGWKMPEIKLASIDAGNNISRRFKYRGRYIAWFWGEISFTKIIGWIITAVAISLGAPFWFDLLNKVMKVRGTGGKPER